MKLGIDVSNWTGNLSATQVAALKANGVSFAIVGTQKPDIARQQIEALEAGGIEVPSVYCFLYWDDGDPQKIADAVSFEKPIWLDCEYVKSPMPGPLSIRSRIGLAIVRIANLEGQFAGIYTGSWWWVPYTDNWTGESDFPLWHAAYQSQPESLHLPQPYGGWTKATIWQWSNGGLAGVNADLNVTEDAPVPEPPPEQDYQQNKIDLAAGILGPKYLVERRPDNPDTGEKVFKLHLAAGGEPDPEVVVAV